MYAEWRACTEFTWHVLLPVGRCMGRRAQPPLHVPRPRGDWRAARCGASAYACGAVVLIASTDIAPPRQLAISQPPQVCWPIKGARRAPGVFGSAHHMGCCYGFMCGRLARLGVRGTGSAGGVTHPQWPSAARCVRWARHTVSSALRSMRPAVWPPAWGVGAAACKCVRAVVRGVAKWG